MAESRAIHAMCANVVYVPMCQSDKVPNACQLLIFLRANVPINLLMCQRCANYSTWCANMPKANQIFNFACRKAYQIFNYFSNEFFNYAQHLQISRYLGNSRKLVSQNKEFKFRHLQNFIKEKPDQPNTFDVVFNRARRINRTIIRLVQSGPEYIFSFTPCVNRLI